MAQIKYISALPVIFGVKYFADALWKVVDKRDIEVQLKYRLVEVKAKENVAIFESLDEPSVQMRQEVNGVESYLLNNYFKESKSLFSIPYFTSLHPKNQPQC